LPRVSSDFAVFAGDDFTVLAGLGMGMRGVVSLAANVVPGPVSRLVDAALQDRGQEAREIHRKHVALLEVDQLETSPGPVKAALAMMNRCGETLRLPLAPVREDTRKRIEKVVRGLKLAKA